MRQTFPSRLNTPGPDSAKVPGNNMPGAKTVCYVTPMRSRIITPGPDFTISSRRRNRPGPVPTGLPVEDDPLWTEAVARLLDQWPEVCHGGYAGSGCDGIALCKAKRPSVVLLDLSLPDIDGFRVRDELSALPCPPCFLLLTARMDEVLLYRLGSGDAVGLIKKSCARG